MSVVGVAVTAAVVIHEIPQVSSCVGRHYYQLKSFYDQLQELSDVSIISKAGGTWNQCLVLNVLGVA
jgi:hypothetical protein